MRTELDEGKRKKDVVSMTQLLKLHVAFDEVRNHLLNAAGRERSLIATLDRRSGSCAPGNGKQRYIETKRKDLRDYRIVLLPTRV